MTCRWFCVALVLIGALGLAACRDQRPEPFVSPDSPAEDDPFAAGAGREPTPKTLYTLSRMLASQGRDDQAAAALGQIIRKHPTFLPAYADLAELHLRRDRNQQAMQVLLDGMKVDPNEPRLVNNLGMCFILRRDPNSAHGLFSRAVTLAPNEPRYRANLAMALGMLKRYDESLALYRQVVSEADAHHNLAILCESAGDHQRAAEEFARARALSEPPRRPAPPAPAAASPAPSPAPPPAPASASANRPASLPATLDEPPAAPTTAPALPAPQPAEPPKP